MPPAKLPATRPTDGKLNETPRARTSLVAEAVVEAPGDDGVYQGDHGAGREDEDPGHTSGAPRTAESRPDAPDKPQALFIRAL